MRPALMRYLTCMVAASSVVLFVAPNDHPRSAPPPHARSVTARSISSTPTSIEISIRISEPQLEMSRAGTRVNVRGATGEAVVDGVDIPVINQFIAIPHCDDVKLNVRAVNPKAIKNVSLAPSTADPTAAADLLVGGADAGWARLVGIQYARGQALAQIQVFPVRYDSGKGELSVPAEIRVQLTPVNPRGPVVTNVGPLQTTLKAFVPNFTDVQPASGPHSRMMHSTGQVTWCATGDDDWEAAAAFVGGTCAADYLMIVADELVASGDSLIEVLATKRAEFNGFNVAIVPLGQIDSTPDNTTTPTLIKNFVQAVYDSTTAGHMGDGHLGFLLLVGDAVNPAGDIILPPFYFDVASYKDTNTNGSDTYFALLDGTDYVPDILVGRLTVDADDQNWELSNVVSKILLYEPIGESASWASDVLLMSGGSDAEFTFEGEGLTGFQNYFSKIDSLIGGAYDVVEMHRLSTSSGGTNDGLFSQSVCDEIANNKLIVGLFDHANVVNFENAFFPLHYDTLQNTAPCLVLSFGSYSGYFDYLGCTSGCCNPSPSYPGLPCRVPYTQIDSLDVIAERLLVQPAGAIAVIAYSRTYEAPFVQRAFANMFRSFSGYRQSTLGNIVLGAKLLMADQTTSLALNLLGDPALGIRNQFDAVSSDSFDVTVSGLDMEFTSAQKDYAGLVAQTAEIMVKNQWKDAVSAIPVEVWDGPPGDTLSTLLDSILIGTISGYSDTTWTASLGTFDLGDHEIYAVADPDSLLDEAVRSNNVGRRTLHVRDYLAGFPVANTGTTTEMAKAIPNSSSDLQIVAGTVYAPDGTTLGSAGSGPFGNLFRNGVRYTVGADAPLGGSLQQIVVHATDWSLASDWYIPGNVTNMIGLDHGRPDSMLVAINMTQNGDERAIRLYTVAGAPKWERVVGTSATYSYAVLASAMAAGDISGDGVSDIVYAYVPVHPTPADSLIVLDGLTGSRVWAVSPSDGGATSMRLLLVDIEDDGVLDILLSTVISGDRRIQCYDATGTLLWQVTTGNIVADTVAFCPGDIDNDGVKEIVFVDGARIGIVTVSGGSASVSSETSLTGYRKFQSVPVLADVTGDDDLDVVVLNTVQEHYLNEYSLELRVLDDSMTLVDSVVTFPWDNNLPTRALLNVSVGDVDSDGVPEFAFITPDHTLHVVHVGSTAGRVDWGSSIGDPLRTGLYEQVATGTYSGHVAIYGRARVLADCTFEDGVTFTSPADVQVGALDSLTVEGTLYMMGAEYDSVRVGIDASETPGSYWGGIIYTGGTSRAEINHAVLTDAIVGIDHDSPLTIKDSRISNISGTGIVSADSLLIADSNVSDVGANGIELGQDVVALLDGSLIEAAVGSGVVCDSCAAQTRILDTTFRSIGVHGAYLQRVHGIEVESSVFESCASAGIRFESADGLVTESRSVENAGGVVCLDYSSPVIEGSKIDDSTGGVTAASESYPVVGHGTLGGSNCITNSSGYHVSNLSSGTIYARHDYWGSICCKPSKFFGNVSCDSCEASSVCSSAVVVAQLQLSGDTERTTPQILDLVNAYPNPFNPSVRIRFTVPPAGAHVRLVVYNVRGQRVATLRDGNVQAGIHDAAWNGIDSHGQPVATGVYFVEMRSGGFRKALKIVLLK